MTDLELELLMLDTESDRVERKASLSDPDRIREAICAFANDLPDHRKPGVVFMGVNDDGSCANLTIDEKRLITLADMRSDGNILPMPSMTVQKRTIRGCELVVVMVQPSDAPPVRFKGRVWIRVGPRRAVATREEERRLSEKRRSRDLPFDLHAVSPASIDDFDLGLFSREYLASAVAPEILQKNDRSPEQQLMSLRFLSATTPKKPTVVGILVIGKEPTAFIPGAYVQFLRIDGAVLSDPIADQKELHGPVSHILRRLDEIFEANIHIATDIQSSSTELRHPDYPLTALQQIARNAIMHRDYETTNAPTRFTWFCDRVEIQNPGGPFGQVTRATFGKPGVTDYRNPHLAEAMRNLGYVQRFGVGIQLARKALQDNGNPPLEFDPDDSHILAILRSRI